MTAPSQRTNLSPVHVNIHTMTLQKAIKQTSVRFSATKEIGEMTAVAPNIRNTLKIFDPRTFPIAISTSFFLAAAMDVTSSGRLVPTATIASVPFLI